MAARRAQKLRGGMPDLSRYLRREQGCPVEIFVEPSAEARLLIRHLGWLVA